LLEFFIGPGDTSIVTTKGSKKMIDYEDFSNIDDLNKFIAHRPRSSVISIETIKKATEDYEYTSDFFRIWFFKQSK
jgi:hypothetical protein